MILKYDHLIGRDYVDGSVDCYRLVMDFYKDNFGIELPDYARPARFWEQGLNLYMNNYHANGFRVLDVHPSEWVPGDVVLMAIQSSIGNHAGILIERGQFIHHFYKRKSIVEKYRGMWQHSTIAVFRHIDVHYEPEIVTYELTRESYQALRRGS